MENKSMFIGASGKHFELAREMRKNPTKAEAKLWKYLNKKTIQGLKFRRQHPIGGFILDFYCHDVKVAIEVDGEIHNDSTQKEYDEQRTILLNELNIEVLRFSNDQVLNKTAEVLNQIDMCICNRKHI